MANATNLASGVNPTVLRWARERAGYSLEEVAHYLKQDADRIRRWEEGDELPTYVMLEALSYDIYKRPVAIFFFPDPPKEPDPNQSFRTLPDFEIKNLAPDTRKAIREALAMQIALSELYDGVNPSEKKIFKDIQIHPNANLSDAAKAVREYLGISLTVQTRWDNSDEALKIWRDAVQDYGIFVFKRSFKQKDIFGFCILDDEFPIIFINNSSAKYRQIFTLFHELAHILLKTNGITKQNDQYINSLVGYAKEVEISCNRFTAEFLVPTSDFDKHLGAFNNIDQVVEDFSDYYKVSREVILRKLLDKQIIDQATYEAKSAEWIAEYFSGKGSKKGGGDYYATLATYLGDKFINIAFRRYYEGKCSMEQLADYLNIKAKSVAIFEQYMFGKVM